MADETTGPVTSRAAALAVVEEIERLLDGGRWAEADGLYVTRCGTGQVFRHLPAAGLGQRAAGAFVATPDRRAACSDRLSPDDLSFYLNDAGLHAMHAGDLATAREYLSASLQHDRGTGNTAQLAAGLRNLAECLGRLGLPGPALETAAEALDWAERSLDDHQVRDAHACLAWAAGLAGDTARAEQHFLIADQLEFAGDPGGNHLYSNRGVWWAEWLARTGRHWAAQLLTDDNETLCRANGWNDPLARCERLLGQFALADDDELPEAGRCLDLRRHPPARRRLSPRPRRNPAPPGHLGPHHRQPRGRSRAPHRGDRHQRSPQPGPRPCNGPDNPRPPQRHPGNHPGPGRRQHSPGPGHHPQPALVRTRGPASPRRPGPSREHQQRLVRPRHRPAEQADPTRPGPRPDENRRAPSRRARHNARRITRAIVATRLRRGWP